MISKLQPARVSLAEPSGTEEDENGGPNLQADRRRVQFALATYLFLFIALNFIVWGWFVVHYHGPHRFPFGERSERFGDILRFTGKHQVWKDPRMEDKGSHLLGSLFPKNYPPLGAVVYLFLLQVCAPYAVPVFCLIVLSSVTVAAFGVWKKARSFQGYRWYIGAAIFGTAVLGWGTEITIMRGNIEGIMWIPVALGAALYTSRRYLGAGIAFAIGCCVKPYPVLWLALMARHRKFRGIVAGIVVGALVSLGSLFVFNPNPIRAYQSISGASNFFENYIAAFRPMDEMMEDHSLFQTMKTVTRVVRNHGLHFRKEEYFHHPNDALALKLYHAYLPIAAALGLFVLWRLWNKPTLNQIFGIACVSTLLPLLAGDYTLNVLLIPMALLVIVLLQDVAEGRARLSLAQMLWYLVPCAWIMAVTPLWNLHGVLKTLALLILLGATLWIPLPSTLFGELSSASRNAGVTAAA